MRWRRGHQSKDVIDIRGGGGGRGGGLGGLPIPMGRGGRVGGGLGLIGVLIFIAIQVLGGGSGFSVAPGFDGGAPYSGGEPIPADQDPDRDLAQFSGYVLDDAQNRWEQAFQRDGRQYERAKMVLYRSRVNSGCGGATSAVGPFYCPADRRVYLDLSFYDDMASQLGASGDFAWAYVIAHEIGHHVQNLLGTSTEARQIQQQDPDNANELSVRLELQADCYSGVWANGVFAAGDLEEGDVEEAMTAAAAVGDDRLQKRAGSGVNPDSFTHGSSAQRVEWFNRGRTEGDASACDTFGEDV